MIDPVSYSAVCRSCGTPVDETAAARDGLCAQCAAAWLASWGQRAGGAGSYPASLPMGAAPYAGYPQYAAPPRLPDPDNPRWGVWSGIGVWVFSVASLFVAQAVAMLAIYFLDQQRGLSVPGLENREAFNQWVLSQHVVAGTIYATIGAHLLTMAFCWAIVTRFRQEPFFASIGWNWAGRSPFIWGLLSVGIFVGIVLANALFGRILPQKESPFDELLKTGPQVRIAVAILATFSAPLVEEIVYRGVIFGGLRKRFSAVPTIAIVTLLFAGVHALQYAGAWASFAGLTLLSLVLTIVRAQSRSLLPCVLIHFVNNAIVSLSILVGRG